MSAETDSRERAGAMTVAAKDRPNAGAPSVTRGAPYDEKMRAEIWETDGGAIAPADRADLRRAAATLPVRVSAPMSTEDQRDAARIQRLPKYRNDVAAPEILIGARELQCIGVSPPHDHPHIYLSVGDAGEVVCPYCATRYRFAPSLGPFETVPADCLVQEDL